MITPYRPLKLPIKLDKSLFTNELAEASFELGSLNSLQRNIPNPSLLIAPLTTKEATTSSKIEGTMSTVRDVMAYEAGVAPPHNDTIEVSNYKKAIIWATRALKERKFNISFVKELHSLLLNNTRGDNKKGDFRNDMVYIGKEGDKIENATYIPPEPYLVQEYMENLEEYILLDKEHPLIKAAMIHYQFEAIHPFYDGNGRIGRLIIPLYLFQLKQLFQPILYLSGYFESNRNNYIDILHKTDETQEYEDWIRFFLIAVKEQAVETQQLIEKINKLKDAISSTAEKMKSPYIHKGIDFLFKYPIFKSAEFGKSLNSKSRLTGIRLLEFLKKEGVVKEFTNPNVKKIFSGRGRLFIFSDLLKIL
jgi:Fic family protein